jgi:hypothetical protein
MEGMHEKKLSGIRSRSKQPRERKRMVWRPASIDGIAVVQRRTKDSRTDLEGLAAVVLFNRGG